MAHLLRTDGQVSATATIFSEAVDVDSKSSEDVRARGTADNGGELEKVLGRQLNSLARHLPQSQVSSTTVIRGDLEKTGTDSNGSFTVEFEENDKRDPAHFSYRKKWAITTLACVSALFSSSIASAYSMGYGSLMRDLNCTQFQATVGLSVYLLGYATVPLVTAAFSEEFGRQPLYIGSSIGFLLSTLMIGLAKNIQTVILGRFLQGSFGSTGATMVGGTIADIWSSRERGLPMSIFAVAVMGGTGLGPAAAGWIEMNPRLGWRWIQWIQMITFSAYMVSIPVILKETRTTVLLTRIAKKMRKETGDPRYRARIEDERPSLKRLIFISCTRPIHLMFTEPVVLSFSLWIGFAWGVNYCLIESISPIFQDLHGFNIGEVGTTFTTMLIGSIIGFFTNMYQEKLYHKQFPTRGPEARLHSACFAAVLFPVGMFIYAWSSYRTVHWMVQVVGIVLYFWATFLMYLAVFSYLADCYGPYASSALAGQSLARNIMSTVFPLFTEHMLRKLGYTWANSLFAFIAAAMIPIPFVLFFYGPAIRKRSKFSRMVLEAQQ